MNFLRNINIRLQFIIPIFIVISISYVYFFKKSLDFHHDSLKHKIEKKALQKELHFHKNLERIENDLVEVVSYFSLFPEIRQSYKFLKTKDKPTELVVNLLLNKLNFVRKKINKVGKFNYDFNFYDEYGFSLLEHKNDRIKTNKRKSLEYVNIKKQIYKGLEISKRGLKLRGIVPLFSENRKREYLGAIEAYVSLQRAIELLYLEKEEEFAIFTHKRIFNNYVSQSTLLQEENKYLSISNFSLVNHSSPNFQLHYIDSTFLKKCFFNEKKEFFLHKSSYFFKISKILDDENRTIALTIYQLNLKDDLYKYSDFKYNLYYTSFFTIVIIMSIIYTLIYFFTKKINIIRLFVNDILDGKITEKIKFRNNDALNYLALSLNVLMQKMQDLSIFTSEITKGNLSINLPNFNENQNLDSALISMQMMLKKAKENETKQDVGNKLQKWKDDGLNQLNDILRKKTDNLDDLSYEILSFLIHYLGANQGGFFIVNDYNKENIFLEQTASYAYDRRKFIKKHILQGEGLIGRCFQEGETIYLTEIPDDYIYIKSGLGKTNPKVILIVPIKKNNLIFGIIEIAFFNIVELPKIKFIEEIGHLIAGVLATFKSNTSFVDFILDAIPSAVFYQNTKGDFLNCNDIFVQLFEISKEKVINHSIFDFTEEKFSQNFYDKNKELLLNKKIMDFDLSLKNKEDELMFLRFRNHPIFQEDGKTIGILGFITVMNN